MGSGGANGTNALPGWAGGRASSAIDRLWGGVLLAVPLVVASVTLKIQLLSQAGPLLRPVRRAINRGGVIPAFDYVAADLVVLLGAFTVLFALIGSTDRTPKRRLLSWLIVQGLTLWLVAAWLAFGVVGRFPSMELIRDFLQALANDAAVVAPRGYVAADRWVTAGLLLLPGLVIWPVLSLRAFASIRRPPVATRGVGLTMIVVLGATVRQVGMEDRTVFHDAILPRTFEDLTVDPGAGRPSGQPIVGRAALLAAFRRITSLDNPPPGQPDGPPPAAVAGGPAIRPNVLLIILETHAARDYDLTQASRWPRLASYLRNGIVLSRHYASHPMSDRSDFTILSGVYDLGGPSSLSQAISARQSVADVDAMPRILRQAGYSTDYYYPARPALSDDLEALKDLGFERLHIDSVSGRRWLESSATERLAVEQRMFARAAVDWEAGGRSQPFLIVLRSMLGHEPLLLPSETDSTAGPIDRDQDAAHGFIAATEDSLIARFLVTLERGGALGNTIVGVVADHGARIADGRRVLIGAANPITYRVPAVFFGGAIRGPLRVITVPTSHADITPTILDLAGFRNPGWFHQGASVLDPHRGARAVFLLGEAFGGSDGVITPEWTYSRYYLSDDERLAPGPELPTAQSDNVITTNPRVAANLRSRLDRFRMTEFWMPRVLGTPKEEP